MEPERITPHKVTKPIQLLTAWLVGLCVVNGAFLATATALTSGLLQAALVIAAIINVPVFIVAIFVLQTKFRPEMQEDVFYAEYLDKKTNKPTEHMSLDKSIRSFQKIEAEISAIAEQIHGDSDEPENKEDLSFPLGIAINDYLPWFSELRKDLKAAGIPTNEIIGKINKSEPPEEFIIWINKFLDDRSLRGLLKVLLKYDFDGLALLDPYSEPSPSDALIGGYGYQKGYAPILQELRDMIEADMDGADLQRYVTFNEIVPDNGN